MPISLENFAIATENNQWYSLKYQRSWSTDTLNKKALTAVESSIQSALIEDAEIKDWLNTLTNLSDRLNKIQNTVDTKMKNRQMTDKDYQDILSWAEDLKNYKNYLKKKW